MPRRTKTTSPRPQPPMPTTVAETADYWPLFVTYLGQERRVNSIDPWWQVDAPTWSHKPVSRIHYRVTLEDGQQMEVFKNMDHGGWYQLMT